MRNALIITAAVWIIAGSRGEFRGAADAASANGGGVLPLTLPEQGDEAVLAFQRTVYDAAQRQARHLLSLVHPWQEDAALLLATDSKSDEHWIRPNAGTVEGLAFLYRFGPYDPNVVGVTRGELLPTILGMMRYLTATHVTGNRVTGDGRPWGDAWQSAHWAQMLGRAAWWLWDDLPDDLRRDVRRVIAHEAARFVDAVPPHQLKNDTKAEENAWNSQIFSVAVLLMPDDPRREAWEQAFQRWVISSFLRPADEKSDRIVDGRPISQQFTGANVYDDFTLENHGMVHPDYMQTFGLSLGCALDFRMTGREPPEALWHNVPGIYENLKWFVLPDGGFVYPSGQDWRLFRNADWLGSHVLMAVFGRDPEAWTLAQRSLDVLRRMQERNPSGAVYQPQEFFFPSTQSDLLRSLAHTWLVLHYAQDVRGSWSERLGVRRLDSGRIILNRTRSAVHTVSWGAVVMAQCVAKRRDRIVSPDQRNGIGHIRLEGSPQALPIKLINAAVTEKDGGFEALLVVEHGPALVRAELRYVSHTDGRFEVSERLTALQDITTSEIATGLIGILNNPTWIYETGRRRVTVDGKTTQVEAKSGATVNAEGSRVIDIDGVLRITGSRPLSAWYAAAKDYERARVTDRLYLNRIAIRRDWKRGETISEHRAVIKAMPPEDAPATE
ncbi:MAG: hypothetical protein GYA33_15855 [Thermogutta sp.]|nr:hypothetical protein [Thermogutta sp.]